MPRAAGFALSLIAVAVLSAIGISLYWIHDLPSIDGIEDCASSQTTTVYADDGTTVLAEFYLQDRKPISLDDMGAAIADATVSVEDSRFYSHNGIDLIGIGRAIVNNMTGNSLEGASTITQQLVRNTVLSDEATDISLKRKIREAACALEVEATHSKDQILEMYLNTINYGDGCYGVESAAEHYYSKPAKDLTTAEAATLAGIPQSPTAYNPVTNPAGCLQRRNVVLASMRDAGCLTEDQYEAASAEDLGLDVAVDSSPDGIRAYPYFTSYVRQVLLNQYSTDQVFEGGLTVYTTLDPALQDEAEAACEAQYGSLADDIEISLVSIDPGTGYIKALVGGKDYYTDQFNLATQATRQAGSSFKMFTLAAAIEQGIDPQTPIDCTSPATIDGWTVQNINGIDYGIRSIQSATAVSSNTGYARLVQTVTPTAVMNMAKRLGITSNLSATPSITLGTYGVTPLEMADAYATLAAGGIHREPCAITKILDRDGNAIYEHQDEPERVLSSEVSYAVTQVLETVFTQGTASAAQLYTGQVAAGKTGTSEYYNDHWLCGYTPQLSTTVWMGCRQERSIPSADCCYVWRTYMRAALAGQAIVSFPTAATPAYNNAFNSSQKSKYGSSKNSSSSAGSSTTGSTSSSTANGGSNSPSSQSGSSNSSPSTTTEGGSGGSAGAGSSSGSTGGSSRTAG